MKDGSLDQRTTRQGTFSLFMTILPNMIFLIAAIIEHINICVYFYRILSLVVLVLEVGRDIL